MADEHKPTRAARILRFTVTSALVVAPLAGCSKGEPPEGPHINTGPVPDHQHTVNAVANDSAGVAPPPPDADGGAPELPSRPIANPVPHPIPDGSGAPR